MCRILLLSTLLLFSFQATNDKKEVLICKTKEYDDKTNVCVTGIDNLGT